MIKHSVNVSDTGSKVEGIQLTCLFNNGENLLFSQHQSILIC